VASVLGSNLSNMVETPEPLQGGDELRRALWQEANRVIIDSTYSGREHQAVGNRWEVINRWLGVPAAVAGALVAGGAAVSALTGGDKGLTATLALIAAGLSAARTFLRPDEIAEGHGLKGDRFISLANDARTFQQLDLRSSLSDDALRDRCDHLSKRRNELRESPPRHLPAWAYKKAKDGIAAGESDYENDPLWLEYPS
jgi:hypothetical protein